MRASGEYDTYDAPTARIKSITHTGEVVVSFNQPMKTLPDLDMLSHGKFMDETGNLSNVMTMELRPSAEQDESKLGFKWNATSMAANSITFTLEFENAVHLSAQEDPETLRILIRERRMLISENNLAIQK